MAIYILPLKEAQMSVVVNTNVNNVSHSNFGDGPVYVRSVVIDNTANMVDVYEKLYNDAGPTIGTTAPFSILYAPASVQVEYNFLDSGLFFPNYISQACVQELGTAGVTNPPSAVKTYITLG